MSGVHYWNYTWNTITNKRNKYLLRHPSMSYYYVIQTSAVTLLDIENKHNLIRSNHWESQQGLHVKMLSNRAKCLLTVKYESLLVWWWVGNRSHALPPKVVFSLTAYLMLERCENFTSNFCTNIMCEIFWILWHFDLFSATFY